MDKKCLGNRAKWSEEDMQKALRIIQEGNSQPYAV